MVNKCAVCGKEDGELREATFSRTPDGEIEAIKHCPTCSPFNNIKGDFYNLTVSFG